jgi:hypothetical protein
MYGHAEYLGAGAPMVNVGEFRTPRICGRRRASLTSPSYQIGQNLKTGNVASALTGFDFGYPALVYAKIRSYIVLIFSALQPNPDRPNNIVRQRSATAPSFVCHVSSPTTAHRRRLDGRFSAGRTANARFLQLRVSCDRQFCEAILVFGRLSVAALSLLFLRNSKRTGIQTNVGNARG